MKILFICADFGIPVFGSKGASVHVRELAAAFNRCGHQVTIAGPVGSSATGDIPTIGNIEFMQIPLSDESKSCSKLVRNYVKAIGIENTIGSDVQKFLYDQELEQLLLERFKISPPDLIYVRASPFSTAGTLISKALDRPLIVEMNAPIAHEQSRYRSTSFSELALAAELKLISSADAICCVSEELRHYVESLNIDPQRIRVIPNGVNPSFFEHHPAKEVVLDNRQSGDGPVLGFVGSLRPWHGMNIMPLLLKKLKPHYPGLKLVIVGESPLNQDLYSDLALHGLEECVIFTGARPYHEIPALIKQFDIALAPYSIPDHDFYFSPMKIFEYMACGVPVVAARIGQIRDIIIDKRNGLLYTPEQLDELAGNCVTLLGNLSIARTLGQRAKQFIRKNHTWDHNAKQITNIVNSL